MATADQQAVAATKPVLPATFANSVRPSSFHCRTRASQLTQSPITAHSFGRPTTGPVSRACLPPSMPPPSSLKSSQRTSSAGAASNGPSQTDSSRPHSAKTDSHSVRCLSLPSIWETMT